MARRRFFVDSIRNNMAELVGEDAQHLARVLRAEIGQCFELSDNRQVWLAEISEVAKDRVGFRILEPIEVPEAPVRITLVAALFKFDRFEWMVEKATELGVEAVVPVESARSEKGLFEAARKRAERWRKIARESSQQSRRARMPEIRQPARFGEIVGQIPGFRLFLDEAPAALPLWAALPLNRSHSESIHVLVGPEGGWTEAEREKALACGWAPVSLGPRILRAETAAIAALAVLGNLWSAAVMEFKTQTV